jgi:hypothetical protein
VPSRGRDVSAHPLTLREPRTLDEALRMMRDDGPLTPLAGCTDVYVGLQFGTEAAVASWTCGGWTRCAASSCAATRCTWARWRRSGRSAPRPPSAHGCRCWPRRRGRWAACRSRTAARWAATSPTAPPRATPSRCWPWPRRVVVLRSADEERRVPFASFYTGYRTTRDAPRRADRGVRGFPVQSGGSGSARWGRARRRPSARW